MILTQQMSDDYANDNGDHCPFCGRNSVGMDGDPYGVDGRVHWGMYCMECGRTWTEKYELIGISGVGHDFNPPSSGRSYASAIEGN